MNLSPPRDESQLVQRANALAGLTLQTVGQRCRKPVPNNLRHHKGWVGELIETALGANAGSRPEPDFPALGIELKTIPIRTDGKPKESTHVCTVPLMNNIGLCWESSLVKRKLTRVLWVPIQSNPEIPLPLRLIGTPLLWSPTPEVETILRSDWEELMDMVCLGKLENINARHGEYLQIRPKAADGKALTDGIGASGQPVQTLPRGFYLRAIFTEQLLRQHYVMPTHEN